MKLPENTFDMSDTPVLRLLEGGRVTLSIHTKLRLKMKAYNQGRWLFVKRKSELSTHL